MQHHTSLLDNLRENPLPDAFEINIRPSARNSEELSFIAERITALPAVEEVSYGQHWIKRFSNILNLFRLTGYGGGILFFSATVLIVANTIRLVLYSRRDEISIMRLVGATDRFIKIPFYLQAMMQAGLGTLMGLLLLYAGFASLTSRFDHSVTTEIISIHFFSYKNCVMIMLVGLGVGWLGCWVSLKQFLKA